MLDFEGRSTYTLTIRAFNNADPTLMDSTTVTITLRNLDDNPPMFTSSTFSFSLSEDSTVNTPVGAVVAMDADGGDSGRVCNYKCRNNSFTY